MAKKIVRLTRHEASEEQSAELRRIFGEGTEIKMVSETLPRSPREAVSRFDELAAEADIVEVVLPPNILEAVLKFSTFCRRGGQVVRAVMERELQEGGSATFTFSHYERIVEVKIVTERL